MALTLSAIYCLVLFSCFGTSIVQGLRCWQCSGKNDQVCQRTGKLVTCVNEQDVCATAVRRYFSVSRVFKQCKQKQSCFNDRKQNWNKYGSRHKCTNSYFSSVCFCCCGEDSCNAGSCSSTITASRCSAPPANVENGRVYCTNGNKVGSQCHYSCTKSGYYLNPSDATTLQCMGNGQWSRRQPCCARPCPPYAPFDLVFMLNRFHPQAREMIKASFWWSFRKLWSVDPEYYRSSRIIFSSIVHPTTFINLTDPWIGGTGARRKLEPNDGITYIGNALRYVKDHVFVGDHRDVIHMDAILLVLDENSDDEVKEAAQALRDDGVLIYVMFMKFNHPPNMQQLLDITGEKEHIYLSDGQDDGIGDRIAKEMIGHMCKNVCGLSDHSHDN